MPLLISGHQRSGTTLLRRLCDSHPAITVTNEFSCFSTIGHSVGKSGRHLLAQWHLVKNRWAYDSAYEYSKHKRYHNLRFTLRYLGKLMSHHRGPIKIESVANALQGVFPHVRIVGDKWPQYMPFLDEFVASDQLLCLVIYRDCRDVTASFLIKVRTEWKKRPWAGTVNTAEKIARNWVDKIEHMERHTDRLYMMRYENLVQDPKRELTALGHWLDVNPDGFNHNMVQGDRIGKHRQNLTAEELSVVIDIAGTTMARMGYK